MSTVGVQSHRGFSDIAVKTVLDLALVNTALMGGLFLNEAMFEHVALRVHADDVPAFLTLSCVFAVVSKFGGLQQHHATERRALSAAPYVVLTFLGFGLLRLLLPHALTFSVPALGLSTFLGVLFIVGSRMRAKTSTTSSKTATDGLDIVENRVERILVIGGAGHIGSALVPELLASGYRVRVLDKPLLGKEGLSKILNYKNLEVVSGDFRDLNTIVQAMSGMDTVVHLGDVLSDPGYAENDDLTVEANRIATRLIGSCAKAVNIRRFIYASSCSVYGLSYTVADESTSLQPSCLYGRAKAGSENELAAIASKKFQPIILRFGTTHGAGAKSRFNSIVSYLAAESQTPSELIMDVPDRLQPFIHVQDIVSAISIVLKSPSHEVCGEIFNVGSDCEVRNLVDAAELVRRHIQFTGLTIAKYSPESHGLQIEFSKIRNRLGYKPERPLEDGIKEVVVATLSGKLQPTPLCPNEEHLLSEDLGLTFRQSVEPSHSHPAKTLLF